MIKKITYIALAVTVLSIAAIQVVFAVGTGPSSGGGGGAQGSSYESSREADAVRYYVRGSEYVQKNDFERAVKMFRRAVALKSDFAEAYNMLGYSLRKTGKFDEAVKNYKKALSISPSFAEAHEYIGEAYLALGDRESAWKHYTILRDLGSKEADELLTQIESFDSTRQGASRESSAMK